MIVGPVYKLATEDGTVLATFDAHDRKYVLWGEYERVTLDEFAKLGPVETLNLRESPVQP